MNWTGGTLSRHSKRGQNALVEKQKQHFAKARANQQTLRGTPARPRIFGMENDEEGLDAKSSRHPSNTSAQRQSKLDAFDDFAPVVSRLSSMELKSVKQNHTVLKRSTKDPRRQESTSSDIAKHTGHRSAERKRSAKDLGPNSNSGVEDVAVYDETELQRQRRQLLIKTDWVGLQAPNPLHMDFVSDRGKENFGKRRRVEPQLAQNQDYNKRPYVSSIIQHAGPHMNAVPSESIQIRIGDDASTNRMSQTQDFRSPAGRVSSQPRSSSSMLLDDHAQVMAEPRHARSNIISKPTQEVLQNDSPLARLNPNTPTREDFVEATDEDYENSSKYEWPVSSDYGRAAQNVHNPIVHRNSSQQADFVVDSLPLEDQAHLSPERPEVRMPNTGHQSEDAHGASVQQVAAQPSNERNDDARKRQPLAKLPHHSPPEAPAHFVKPRLLNLPKLTTKQIEPAANTSVPPTPASLAGLNALCQTRTAPGPTEPAPKVEDDADAIWKAFVFGNPKSPSMNKKVAASNLTHPTKPATSSLEVRPPTPKRRHRSSSILTSIPSDSANAYAKTTAATVAHSSSSAFQSDDRAVNNNIAYSQLPNDHLSLSGTVTTISEFDRVSSVANASTIPAILRTDRPVFRRSSPDPLIVDHDRLTEMTARKIEKQSGFRKPKIIFNRPRPFEGSDSKAEERYEIVHVGRGVGRRAREILKDAEGEEGMMEDIEEV